MRLVWQFVEQDAPANAEVRSMKGSVGIVPKWTKSWCKVRVKLDYNFRPVREHVKLNANRVMRGVLEETVKLAKENVAPGKGPGPHPHLGRMDTGNLMRDIRIIKEPYWWTTHAYGQAGCTEAAYYGVFLEWGWTNPWTGNFWRYPWLMPAYEQARKNLTRWYQHKISAKGLKRYWPMASFAEWTI